MPAFGVRIANSQPKLSPRAAIHRKVVPPKLFFFVQTLELPSGLAQWDVDLPPWLIVAAQDAVHVDTRHGAGRCNVQDGALASHLDKQSLLSREAHAEPQVKRRTTAHHLRMQAERVYTYTRHAKHSDLLRHIHAHMHTCRRTYIYTHTQGSDLCLPICIQTCGDRYASMQIVTRKGACGETQLQVDEIMQEYECESEGGGARERIETDRQTDRAPAGTEPWLQT